MATPDGVDVPGWICEDQHKWTVMVGLALALRAVTPANERGERNTLFTEMGVTVPSTIAMIA